MVGKYETPNFLEVFIDGKTVYVPFEEAVSNPQIRTHIANRALVEAVAWYERYAAFFDRIDNDAGTQIVEAIGLAKEKMSATAPDQATGMDIDPNSKVTFNE